MIKTVENILKGEKGAYQIPKNVRSVIPITTVYEDGIFRNGKSFSKTYSFSDINYLVSSKEDKENMFLKYSEILNSLDSGAISKISIINSNIDEKEFESTNLMKLKNDSLDVLRVEFNELLQDKIQSKGKSEQKRFLTVTVLKPSYEEAASYFLRVTAELKARFSSLGSSLKELDASSRLEIFKNFYAVTPGDTDIKEHMRQGKDIVCCVSPKVMERTSTYINADGKYTRTLYLKDYASYIRDDFLTDLMESWEDMALSIDIIPVPTDEAVKEVERKLLGVETNITNFQRRQNENGNFSAVIPYDMEAQRREAKEYLNDLLSRDQRMMFALLTVAVSASSLSKLDGATENVMSCARKHMCMLSVLKYQQTDALNTVLPYGVRKVKGFRTLTTESLAVLMPFKVQEISESGGLYLGDNAISKNAIFCNRENLKNGSSIILGIPGSGKSLFAKSIIWQIILNTDDDICICDPEGEYDAMLSSLPKSMCSRINMSAGGKDRLNAMYMVDGYGEDNPIVVKSQFILSLIEQIDPEGIGPRSKSVIDRCVAKLYEKCKDENKCATLSLLRKMLLEEDEEIAKDIALSLELYTDGSLDIFGGESNVNLNARILNFDIHSLGAQLKNAGLLVITDTILNRVTQNWKRGKRTHVFIDEFHVVFENEHSAAFFNMAWRQFRKRNAYPTAITQNVEYMLKDLNASGMLSNSEFVVMLSQSSRDRGRLSELMNISDEQMNYLTNADPGSGLIRYGAYLVPFENKFPKNTTLYNLMTTKPGEGAFSAPVRISDEF